MVKPKLLYLYEKGEHVPVLEHWPELGRIELVESDELYMQNFCMGFREDLDGMVFCMQANSKFGLRYLLEVTEGSGVIALRGEPDQQINPEWDGRLQQAATERALIVTMFNRHDVAAALGRKAFWDGLELIQIAASYLQGPAIFPSDDALRSEITIQRAIESLSKAGYKTPRK